MINFKSSELKGLGRVKLYGIAGEETTDEAVREARKQDMEIKTFDFFTFWRVKHLTNEERSVVFSCRQGVELGILEKIAQVAESGSPLIVNSLQKVRGAAIKKCKIIGVNITPHMCEPGISAIDQLEEIVRDYGMVVRTVSYNLNWHRDIEELNMVLESIRVSSVLSEATIIDLGEYKFESDEEAMEYMAVLEEFRKSHGDHFEYRFGVRI